jgi:type III secretion system FlhB-like substrate exporter
MIFDIVSRNNKWSKQMSENSIIYAAGKEIGETISALQRATEDKKIKFGEWLEIGKEGGELAITIIKNFGALKDAVENGISAEENEELISGLKEGYDIADEEAEALFEAVAESVVSIVSNITTIVYAVKAATGD